MGDETLANPLGADERWPHLIGTRADRQHRALHLLERDTDRGGDLGIAPGLEVIRCADEARRLERVHGVGGVVGVRLALIGRQWLAAKGPRRLELRNTGREGTVAEVRRDVEDGGGEVLGEITGRETGAFRSARGAHDGHALRARVLLQPLRPGANALERYAAERRRQ